MFGKLSKGLQSIGVNIPPEAQKLEGVADAIEKGGLKPEAIAEGLKDVLENKTEAPPETKKEMEGKLEKMTNFIKSGALSPSLITTLISVGQALAAKDYEKAKTEATTLVTGDDAGKNLKVISEILNMVKS